MFTYFEKIEMTCLGPNFWVLRKMVKIICFESPWPSTHLAREEIHPGAAGCSLQRQNSISKNKMATFMMYVYIYICHD